MKKFYDQFKGQDSWCWGYGSPVTMAAFRLLIGFWALCNWVMISIDFDAWFGRNGYVPLSVNERWMGTHPRLNLLSGVDNDNITAAFYALVVLAALCTFLGLGTRIATIVLAIGTITLHHRNSMILHGGDTALRLGCIYLAVSPCGKALSLDRLIALWRGKAPPIPIEVSLWPQRLVQFNMALVYVTAVWHKWSGITWRNGTATYYPPFLREFYKFDYPPLVQHSPWMEITTWGTLVIQFALGTIVFWRPARKWVLLSGLLLHAQIEWMFNIPLFAFIMCSYYISHYEGYEISEWVKRLGQRFARFRMVLRAPKGKELSTGPGLALAATDILDLVEVEPGESDRWSTDQGGSPFWKAWLRSPGGWILWPIWRKMHVDAVSSERTNPQ